MLMQMVVSPQKDLVLTTSFPHLHGNPLIALKPTEIAAHNLPEHAGVIPSVIEKSRPEPKGVFILTDVIVWETIIDGLLQIPVLRDPVPDQGQASRMGCAIVVLQEGLKKWAFDLGRLPIINLDLLHGVHTPVIAAFCSQEEQGALGLQVCRRKRVLPMLPTAPAPAPTKIRGKTIMFSMKANWPFIKQSKNIVFISREPGNFCFHLYTSYVSAKLFISHQDNRIGYSCIKLGFLELQENSPQKSYVGRKSLDGSNARSVCIHTR